jgi:glycosyltransferase involved in cell wall biosynthesis
MTVYNGERFLAQAIESILNQTYKDFELVVIDDDSSDKTCSILEEYERLDDRVRYFRQNHLGLVASRNNGCRLARGEYIACMDADDIAIVDRIEKQVAFLDGHPVVAVLGGAMVHIDEKGVPTGVIVRNPTRDRAIKRALLSASCLAQPTVMMRKDAFDTANGYRSAFLVAEDYDLWLRMAERFELANLPDCVLYYRIHPQQLSLCHLEQQVMCTAAAQAAAKARRRSGRDPIDQVHHVTRHILAELGVSAETLRFALVRSYIRWAAYMLHSGDKQTTHQILSVACEMDSSCLGHLAATYGYYFGCRAMEELHVLLEVLSSQPRHVRSSVIARFYLGCAKAYYENRRLVEGTKSMIKACALEPGQVAKSVVWGFRKILALMRPRTE